MFRSDRDDLTCTTDRKITSSGSHLVQHEDELVDIRILERFSHEIKICRCREIGG